MDAKTLYAEIRDMLSAQDDVTHWNEAGPEHLTRVRAAQSRRQKHWGAIERAFAELQADRDCLVADLAETTANYENRCASLGYTVRELAGERDLLEAEKSALQADITALRALCREGALLISASANCMRCTHDCDTWCPGAAPAYEQVYDLAARMAAAGKEAE